MKSVLFLILSVAVFNSNIFLFSKVALGASQRQSQRQSQQRSLPSNLAELPSPSYPWILTKDGKIHTGTILRLTEEELFFALPTQNVQGAQNMQKLNRSEIASILFVPPIDPIAVRRFFTRYLRIAEKDRDTIILSNADRFSGRILHYSERKMSLQIPGLNEPITIPMRRIRAVVFH